MREGLVLSVILGLFLAVLVYLVGTALTSFDKEGLLWGLAAIAVFFLAVFGRFDRGRRL